MKKRYYILIAIFSYLFFTLGNVPAAKVISLVEQNTQLPIKLYGVYGSIWNGGADKAVMQGQPAIDNIEWSINPAMLLLASLAGEVKASIKEQNVIGNVRLSAAGNFSASDVRARIDAAVLQELIQMPLGEIAGVFNINIISFEANPDGLPAVTADINWKNAKFTLMETVDLGFIDLSIAPGKDNQLIAKITSSKGQLQLDGKASIDNNKAYDLNLRITPEKNASQNVRQSIVMFARRQADGSYLTKRKGNLRDLGF